MSLNGTTDEFEFSKHSMFWGMPYPWRSSRSYQSFVIFSRVVSLYIYTFIFVFRIAVDHDFTFIVVYISWFFISFWTTTSQSCAVHWALLIVIFFFLLHSIAKKVQWMQFTLRVQFVVFRCSFACERMYLNGRVGKTTSHGWLPRGKSESEN